MKSVRKCGGLVLIGWMVSVVLVSAATRASAAPSNVASWRRNGLNTQTLGWKVGSAGDFNCDGIEDLAIGAPFASSLPNGTLSSFHQGWVGIWYGDSALPSQPSEPPDWFVTGNDSAAPSESELGFLFAAGDVNGDDCDDFIVGNRATPAGGAANVRAYFGAPGGGDTTFDWRRTIISTFGVTGNGEIATGDVTGDGVEDIVVGVPDAQFGEIDEGAVFVWVGGPNLANVLDGPANPDWIAESNQPGARLGYSVSSGGDVDGDGKHDIVAGAPGWDGSIPNSGDSGIALMWLGSSTIATDPNGTVANAAWSLQIGASGAALGSSVAIAGDVDGDGFEDILAGAPFYDNPFTVGTGEGTVVVTRGASPAPPTDIFSWTHFGQNKGWLGWSVAGAGDVDGDGRADYLMGEPRDIADPTLFGRAHLLLGRPTASWGPNPATDVFFSEQGIPGTPHAERYGVSVGSPGDWNDDGLSDIVVGAPGIDNTGAVFSLDGVAFVYLGNDLMNGWTNYGFGTRSKSVEMSDGIVTFKGALANGTTPDLFSLPVEMRPATTVYVAIDLCSAVPGRLIIQPSGQVSVQSSTTFGAAQCFTSLEGAKFAPSATGFTNLTPANSWFNAPFGTSHAAAAKINGVVHLKGAVSNGTDPLITTLPPEMRPATDVYVPIGLCNGLKGRLLIQPTGAVIVQPQNVLGDAQCFTSLDGVSFVPSPNGFAALALVNDWVGAPYSTSLPAGSVVRTSVHLKGSMWLGSSQQAFTLPPLLRPEGIVYVPVDLCNSNKGRLLITPNGEVNVLVQSGDFTQAQCFTSLDGVTYTVPEPLALHALVSGVILLAGIRRSKAGRGRSEARVAETRTTH